MRYQILLTLIFIQSIAFVQKNATKYSRKELTKEIEQVKKLNLEMNSKIYDLTNRMTQMEIDMIKLEDKLVKQEELLVELNQMKELDTNSTKQSSNPFGSGGNGGRGGSGNGPFDRPENGATDGGNGGVGTGKIRFRLNNVNLPQYDIDVDCRIGLKITINADGVITDCRIIKSVTTCKNQTIINDVITRVKQQVKYNQEKGAQLTQVEYTIAFKAR